MAEKSIAVDQGTQIRSTDVSSSLDRGERLARAVAAADRSGLTDLDIAVSPDVKYQSQREATAFFYVTDLEVPASFGGVTNAVLFFPGLIARAVEVRVNGKAVEFDHGTHRDTLWRGPVYFWMNYDHRVDFDVTGLIQPGATNTVAVRVFKSFDFGGSYRRPWLLGW